jgi:hypothetical protein
VDSWQLCGRFDLKQALPGRRDCGQYRLTGEVLVDRVSLIRLAMNLEALRNQKYGSMQNLLAVEWCVPIDEGETT